MISGCHFYIFLKLFQSNSTYRFKALKYLCRVLSSSKIFMLSSSSSLQDLLIPGTGRGHADMLVEAALNNPDFFQAWWMPTLPNTEPYSRKAAWAIDLCVEQNPELIYPYRRGDDPDAGKIFS